MRHHHVYFIFLLLITLIKADFSCKSTEDCECIRSATDYIYECPTVYSPVIRIRVIPGQLAEILCLNRMNWKSHHIPTLQLGSVNNLILESCSIDEMNSTWILQRLGISDVENLSIHHSSGVDNVTIEFFETLNDIKELSLYDNNLKRIDKNAINSLRNLTEITLRDNNVQLTGDLFRNLTELELLDLSSNKLTDLPEGLFENMRELKILYLWANNLTTLSNDTFANLHSLELLELSRNRLELLPEDVFSQLKHLTRLSLSANNLKDVPEELFSTNTNLESIRMNINPSLGGLPENLFSNLGKLQILLLDNCNITSLPENLFGECSNLETLSLNHNKLEALPESVFRNLKSLEILDLSYNRFSSLPDKIFSSLTSLVTLNLGSNALTNISGSLFYNLQNLETLNLKQNKISTLSIHSMQMMISLKDVVLSHNNLRFDDNDISPLVNNLRLEKVDVSHNRISNICTDFLINKLYLKELDLSHNNISYLNFANLLLVSKQVSLNLSNNQISTIDFRNAEALTNSRGSTMIGSLESIEYTLVNLNNNPLKCDCQLFDFVKYLEKVATRMVASLSNLVMAMDNLSCSSPRRLLGKSVSQLKSESLTCLLNEIDRNFECPNKCDCEFWPTNKTLVYDCSYRNLTEMPKLNSPDFKFYKEVEVNMHGNLLKSGPEMGADYKDVTKLILSNNSIEEISWLPPNLHTLKMENNKLSTLNHDVLVEMNSTHLKTISLGNNPWNCDCSTAELIDILIANLINKQIDMNQIRCVDNEKLLIYMNSKDLCTTPYLSWSIIICGTFAITAFFLAVVLVITKRKPKINNRSRQ